MTWKQKYYDYMDSMEWIDKSNNYKERYPVCQICGTGNQHMSWVHCHHITYENLFNESDKDLITLCKPCHKKAHSKEKIIKLNMLKQILEIKDDKNKTR